MVSHSGYQSSKQSKTYYTKENYYQTNSEKGFFYSNSTQLLEHLGLAQGQELTQEAHYQLIDGFNPKTNEALANNAGAENRRSGFDFTASAPKSFSILQAFAKTSGNIKLLEKLQEVQKVANQRMMQEASKYALTRLSDDKRTRVKADIIYGTFNHGISRVSKDGFIDPAEHNHNFIYNMVGFTDEDGNYKIQSLENKQMLKMEKYLGNFYRNEMSVLLKDIGIEMELENASQGFATIKGFDKEKHLIPFSNRSLEIREDAKKLLESGKVNPNLGMQKLIELARLVNYKAKKQVDTNEVYEQMGKRFELEGINGEFINNLLNSHEIKEVSKAEKQFYLKRAYESISQMKAVWSIEDLKSEFAKTTVHLGISLNEVDNLVIEDSEIIKLDANKYATKTLIEQEKKIISLIDSKTFALEDNREKVDAYLKEKNIDLTFGQNQAVNMVLNDNHQIMAIQGDAGSGKTFSLGIIKEVYKDKYDFIGLAPTGKASQGLGEDANVETKTIDSYLLNEIKRNKKPRVIFLDETGMVDSAKLAKLVDSVIKNKDKLILIGDTKQYMSVGAGKIFEDLQKYGITVVSVTENQRQKTQELRDAVENLKDANVEKAFENLSKSTVEYKRMDRLLQEVVIDYSPDGVVLAPKNEQRNQLNLMIREKLVITKFLNPKESLEIENFKNAKPNGTEKYSSTSYEIGQILTIDSREIKGFKAGQRFTIVGKDGNDNLILDTISTNKTGRDRTRKNISFSIKDNADKVSVFSITEKNQFVKNEKIIFTKGIDDRDAGISFKNGTTAEILKIEGKFITVKTDAKREFTFDAEKYPFFDYGYAITDYKSQGMSINKVQVLGDHTFTSLNALYVQITRAKHQLKFYTTNLEKFMERAKNEQIKESTLDFTMKSDFKEKEKMVAQKFRTDALDFVEKERKLVKENLSNTTKGNEDAKRNDGLNGKDGQKDGLNGKDGQKDGLVGKTKHPTSKLDARTRENISKLIQSVSNSFRREGIRWRKSLINRVKENWANFRCGLRTFERPEKLNDAVIFNKMNREVDLKEVFKLNNLDASEYSFTKNSNGFHIAKNLTTNEEFNGFQIYSKVLGKSVTETKVSYLKDAKNIAEKDIREISEKDIIDKVVKSVVKTKENIEKIEKSKENIREADAKKENKKTKKNKFQL